MMMITLEGVEQVQRRFAALGLHLFPATRRGLARAGQRGAALLQAFAPRSTQQRDHLADSFRSAVGGTGTELYADITTTMPDRARFVREGTRPHPITARPGGVLRFDWPQGPRGPGIYFFRRVNHPGTAPNDFVAAALDEIRQAALAELTIAIAQEVDRG